MGRQTIARSSLALAVVAIVASTSTARAQTPCASDPTWEDADGNTCADHEDDLEPDELTELCEVHGGVPFLQYGGSMVSANQACTVCGAFSDPTWRDGDGDTCAAWNAGDCQVYGREESRQSGGSMVSANQACTVCGAPCYNPPTPAPTTASPSPLTTRDQTGCVQGDRDWPAHAGGWTAYGTRAGGLEVRGFMMHDAPGRCSDDSSGLVCGSVACDDDANGGATCEDGGVLMRVCSFGVDFGGSVNDWDCYVGDWNSTLPSATAGPFFCVEGDQRCDNSPVPFQQGCSEQCYGQYQGTSRRNRYVCLTDVPEATGAPVTPSPTRVPTVSPTAPPTPAPSTASPTTPPPTRAPSICPVGQAHLRFTYWQVETNHWYDCCNKRLRLDGGLNGGTGGFDKDHQGAACFSTDRGRWRIAPVNVNFDGACLPYQSTEIRIRLRTRDDCSGGWENEADNTLTLPPNPVTDSYTPHDINSNDKIWYEYEWTDIGHTYPTATPTTVPSRSPSPAPSTQQPATQRPTAVEPTTTAPTQQASSSPPPPFIPSMPPQPATPAPVATAEPTAALSTTDPSPVPTGETPGLPTPTLTTRPAADPDPSSSQNGGDDDGGGGASIAIIVAAVVAALTIAVAIGITIRRRRLWPAPPRPRANTAPPAVSNPSFAIVAPANKPLALAAKQAPPDNDVIYNLGPSYATPPSNAPSDQYAVPNKLGDGRATATQIDSPRNTGPSNGFSSNSHDMPLAFVTGSAEVSNNYDMPLGDADVVGARLARKPSVYSGFAADLTDNGTGGSASSGGLARKGSVYDGFGVQETSVDSALPGAAIAEASEDGPGLTYGKVPAANTRQPSVRRAYESLAEGDPSGVVYGKLPEDNARRLSVDLAYSVLRSETRGPGAAPPEYADANGLEGTDGIAYYSEISEPAGSPQGGARADAAVHPVYSQSIPVVYTPPVPAATEPVAYTEASAEASPSPYSTGPSNGFDSAEVSSVLRAVGDVVGAGEVTYATASAAYTTVAEQEASRRNGSSAPLYATADGKGRPAAPRGTVAGTGAVSMSGNRTVTPVYAASNPRGNDNSLC